MDESNPSTTSGVLASSKAEAPRGRDPHSGSGRLEVRCPNCHTPMEVAVDTLLTDLTCSVCGSHFSLVDQSQATRMAPPLSTMGRFELIERLGVGGFGSVWKARDRELDRTVAIKIPRQGGMTAEQQEKFFREARAAAQLRHQSIVSVHEVGRDGENVYIVSDFVRGVTLGDWLTGQKPTSRESAELCAKIAGALHHAHEQGVIHRDLKPANIMIDGAGEPHLMDFGLARRDAGEITVTLDGEVLGTPAYMSPEQALGESHTADRRSDVYSVGVVLFQLLTGELPFRGNARMIMHQVIHDEPPNPRKLNANVSDDLETIALKCLEKEPARRYATARELADDLRRFLAGEPIQARPTSRIERTARWMRRNPAVSALSAAVLVALMAGTIVSAYFARDALGKAALALAREQEANGARRDAEQRQKEANAARHDAEQRQKDAEQARVEEAQSRQSAEAVTDFLVKAFKSPDPAVDGSTITVAEVLARAEKQLEEELSNQPLTKAALLQAIGRSRSGLGMHQEALAPLTRARELYQEKLGSRARDTQNAMFYLAQAYGLAGRNNEAIALLEQLQEAQRRSLRPDDDDMLVTQAALASVYGNVGRLQDAISLLEETLAEFRTSWGPYDAYTLTAMQNLAGAYADAGRTDDAIKLLEETLAATKEKLGPRHARTLSAMKGLGVAYHRAGRREEAIQLLEEAFAGMREVQGVNHPDTLRLAMELVYQGSDTSDQVIQILEENLAQRREKLGPNHPDTIYSMEHLGYVYLTTGRADKAIALYERTVAGYRERFGVDHPSTLEKMGSLASAYSGAGRLNKAVPLYEETLARLREILGPKRPETLRVMNGLAKVYAAQWRPDKAIPLHEEALHGRREQLGPNHRDTQTSIKDLAYAYVEAGRLDEAMALYQELIHIAGESLAKDDETLKVIHSFAHQLANAGKYKDAVPLFQVTRDARLATLGEMHSDTLDWTNCLADTLTAAGRTEEALPLLEQILTSWRTKLRPDNPGMLMYVKNLMHAYRASGRFDLGTRFFNEQLLHDGYFYQGLQIGTPEVVDAMIDAAMSDRHRAEALPEPVDAAVLGKLRLMGGDPKTAEAAIRAGIARAPAGYMHQNLGCCLLAQGKSDEAKQVFLEVLKDRRQEGGTFNLEGANQVEMTAAYFLDLISEEEYVAHTAGKSEQVAGHRVELACFPWFYVGQRREFKGNRDAAIAAYEKCVELGDDETAHSNRALARWRLAKLREGTERKTDLQQ